ncbi:MAG: choice-of-anchor D domain-containing protein [Acidobacteria bacterium]|nr:MAG: choice-of-anchor D domain-containing protein [Acidobacteriota bacterium]
MAGRRNPSDKRPPASGQGRRQKPRGPMVDLPLRPGSPAAPGGQQKLPLEGGRRRPPTKPGYGAATRRRGKRRWPLILLLLALLGVAAYFLFWPKPPRAAFSPLVLDAGEQRVQTTGDPVEVVVTNAGERPMTVIRAVITGAAAEEFAVVSEECSGVIMEPGGSCPVKVGFTPGAMGAREAVLELHGELVDSPATLSLVGTGIAPLVGVEPRQVDFGSRGVGRWSESVIVTVSNTGTAPLTVERLAIEGPAADDFGRNDDKCGRQTLSPGESCTVKVGFLPRAAGERVAQLAVHSDALEETLPVRLAGMGEWTGPALSLSAEEVDFGARKVGEAVTVREIKLVNRQDQPVSGLRVGVGDRRQGFSLSSENCSGGSLAPGAECVVKVAFKPAAEGSFGTALEITHPSVEGSLLVGLAGSGVAPRLSWVSTRADFEAARAETGRATRTLELRNQGTAAAKITEVSITGGDDSGFSKGKDECAGGTVQPGSSCRIEVVFEPKREGGHQAELTVRPAPHEGPANVALAGTGMAPRLAFDRELLDFGRVARTTFREVDLVLRNPGSAPLTIRELQVAGEYEGEFIVSGGTCSISTGLGPGEQCLLKVRFTPQEEGRRSARLLLDHDGLSGAKEVPLGGAGTPPPIPRLEVTPASIDFGQQPVGQRSSISSISCSNPGTGRVDFRDFEVEGAGAGDFYIVPATCDAVPYLLPGANCSLGIRFVPSVPGVVRAELVIRHTADARDRRVTLVGEGI